jgi:hypothetical protein
MRGRKLSSSVNRQGALKQTNKKCVKERGVKQDHGALVNIHPACGG